MKQILLLIALGILMSNNLTAQSERINISKENKIEVVKTLKVYPLVLNELKLTNNALNLSNKIVNVQIQELQTKDVQINLLSEQISNLEKQKKLFKKQLKRQKIKPFIVAGVGIATLLLIK